MRSSLLLALLLTSSLLGGALLPVGGQSPNQAPTADAGHDLATAVGVATNFNGSGSSDPDNDILFFSWDFDNANGLQQDASGPTPVWTFQFPGQYTVTLTVDDGSLSGFDTLSVVVEQTLSNHNPVAVITEPQNGDVVFVSADIPFDGTDSYDPDGDPINYSWDFGNAIYTTATGTYPGFDRPGVVAVTLTVSDGVFNSTATSTLIVLVVSGPGGPPPLPIPRLPSACFTETSPWYTWKPSTFDGSCSHDQDSGQVNVTWDFDLNDGLNPTSPDSTERIAQWAYHDVGTYTVTLVVVDDDPVPKYNFTQKDIVIVAHPKPTVNAGPDVHVDNGKALTLAGSATPNRGDQSNTSQKIIFRNDVVDFYAWDFQSDGIWDWNSSATGVATHTYNLPEDPKEPVEFLATLMACTNYQPEHGGYDNVCDSNATHVIINAGPNSDPIADAGPAVKGFVGESVTLHGSGVDSDGFIATYEWDFNSDGTFDWSSTASGTATTTYQSSGTFSPTERVTDDRGATAQASTTVTIAANGVPVADACCDQSVKVGQTISLDGSGSTDPDKEPLSYLWDYDSSDGIGVDSTLASPTVSYATRGTYVATLKVRDPHGAESAADEVTLTVTQSFGAELTGAGTSQLGEPNQQVVFTLTLTNKGDGPDDFTLLRDGGSPTYTSVITPTQLKLGAGESSPVSVRVLVPVGAKADESQTLTITATSVGSTTGGGTRVSASATLTLKVKELHNADLQLAKKDPSVAQGGHTSVTLTIRNDGNVKDTIKVSASGAGQKLVSFSPTSVTLEPTKKADVTVTIAVSADTPTRAYTVTITGDAGGVKATTTLTITVTAGGPSGTPGFEGTLSVVALLAALAVATATSRRR